METSLPESTVLEGLWEDAQKDGDIKVHTFWNPAWNGYWAEGLEVNLAEGLWRIKGHAPVYKIGQGGPFVIDGAATGVFVHSERLDEAHKAEFGGGMDFLYFGCLAQESLEGKTPLDHRDTIYESYFKHPTRDIGKALRESTLGELLD